MTIAITIRRGKIHFRNIAHSFLPYKSTAVTRLKLIRGRNSWG